MNKLKQKLKDKLGEKKIAKIKRALPTIRLIKNIICWTLIALIAVAVIIFAVTRITGGTPSIFGYSIHRVLTGSMEPELSVNEIILNKDISDPAEITITYTTRPARGAWEDIFALQALTGTDLMQTTLLKATIFPGPSCPKESWRRRM